MKTSTFLLAIVGTTTMFINSAAAWHSRSECMKNASPPHCEAPLVPVCNSRKPCVLEHGKTINACVDWRCDKNS